MLKVFAGDDRVAAQKAVKRALGVDYEVFEGEQLAITDLPSIFQGMSLLGALGAEKRYILLKDVSENAAVWEKIPDYAETEHEVVIWETKLDKRSATYKKLKSSGVVLEEFSLQKPPEAGLVFSILDTALRDGTEAVRMVEKIELTQDPYMFFGLMVTQALKKFEAQNGVLERKILKKLAQLDIQMKTTAVEPWTLVKAFLLEVGN